MRRIAVVLSIVLILIVVYILCFGFRMGIEDEQASSQANAFADVLQIQEKHPKMHLIHQIDAEIETLSLWQRLLDDGLFVEIPSESYESGFVRAITSSEYLEDTIAALQIQLGMVNGVEQLEYVEAQIFEEAHELIEKEVLALETSKMETVEAAELRLLSELNESVKWIRDQHRIHTFNIRLKLEFLDLSQEEKSALVHELHRIKRDCETEEESLRAEMARVLESLTQVAYDVMSEKLQDIENTVWHQARNLCEAEKLRIQGVSLPESARNVCTDMTSIAQDSSTLCVAVPEFGDFYFCQFSNSGKPEFGLTMEWCEQELERLLMEKEELERSIVDEIKVIAISAGRAQNMRVEFIDGDKVVHPGLDLSDYVLDMIKSRYEWYEEES